MALRNKDLLGIQQLCEDEITEILDLAQVMKKIIKKGRKKADYLEGKSVVTLFYENSTRTRVSFELATQYLGGILSTVSATASSVQKGESLIDTGLTLDMMGIDVIILRHPASGTPRMLAEHVEASVINAGDGMNEHPTQALLDMFTMRERFGTIKGLKVAIIGDILHSRVARSNMWGLLKMGATVTFAGPDTLLPKDFDISGVSITTDIREAIYNADVIMGLRIQKERQDSGLFPSISEYSKYFGINEENIKLANPEAILMHPGPVNRGVEISSSLIRSPQSVIQEQVKNGVAVRMAILTLLTGGDFV